MLAMLANKPAAGIAAPLPPMQEIHRSAKRNVMETHDDSYRELFEASPDVMLVHVDGRICMANPAAARLYRVASAAAMVGLEMTDFVHPDDRALSQTRARSAQRERTPQSVRRMRARCADATYIHVEAIAQPTRFGGKLAVLTAIRDITAERAASLRAQRLGQLYLAQSLINDAVARAVDFCTLCDTVCRVVVEQGGIACALVRLYDPERGLLLPVAFHGPETGLVGRAELPAHEGVGISAVAFQSRHRVVVADSTVDPVTQHIGPAAEQHGIRSAAAFPLLHGGGCVGTFALFGAGEGFFDVEMADLLEKTASILAYAQSKLAMDAALVAREREAQQAGRTGSVVIDLRAGQWRTSEVGSEILGIDARQPRPLADFEALLEPASRDEALAVMRANIQSGKLTTQTYALAPRPNGKPCWIEVVMDTERDEQGVPLRRVGTVRDVTASHLAAQRIGYLTRLYAALSKANEAAARAPSFAAVCKQVCEVVVTVGGFTAAAIRLHNSARAQLELVAAHGPRGGLVGRDNVAVDDPVGVASRAFREGHRVVVKDFESDPHTRPAAADAKSFGIHAAGAFAVRAQDVVAGTFAVFASSGGGFDEQTEDLLERIAAAVGFSLAKFRSEAARAESEARMSAIVGSAMDAIITCDGQLQVVVFNAAAEAMLGCSASAAMGKPLDCFLPERVRSGHAGQMREFGRSHGVSRVMGRTAQVMAVRGDGTEFPVEAAISYTDIGGKSFYTVIMRDVAAKLAARRALAAALAQSNALAASLEQRVVERTADLSLANHGLQAANRDLESFSYSVAHDLRAPLRSIGGFAGLVSIDLESNDLEAVASHTKRIVSSVARMNQLIDGLLAIARVTHGALKMEAVHFRELVRDAIAEACPSADARFEVADLPVVRGDAAAFRQVWSNLISNAVKYSAKRVEPVIQISVSASGGEHIFQVRDNGAGFEPAYTSRLFGVFERLHSVQEFEGTGVGLAVVRRIVERHGGRVWADGEVDAGATFFFALPDSRVIEE